MQDQLAGLKPSAYAPYGNPREYITSWTDKIWISRGLGHLRDHYAPGVKVHTAYGETYGYDDVIRNSIQKMVAFPQYKQNSCILRPSLRNLYCLHNRPILNTLK